MSNIPTNVKLWNMLIAQAKTKFRVWPSAAASAWVHQRYVEEGGKFVESVKQMSTKERAEHQQASKKKGSK